jgi:hypothetical protein
MRRTALVVAAALAAGGAAVAGPASARLVPAEPAGALTTIATASSGTAELVLYDDATVSPLATHNPDVSITGPGRLVAFQLTRADGTGDELYGARMPSFAGGGVTVGGSTTPTGTCTAWPSALVPVQQQCTTPRPTGIRLHEGYYHLMVVTDGKPVRITLRLHGEERRTARVHVQQQIRTLEANLPERESVGSTTVSYGASAGFHNATQVLTVVDARLHRDATMLAATGCARDDSGAPPPYAYTPPCPGGSMTGFSYLVHTPVDQLAGFGAGTLLFFLTNGGPTGIGGSFIDSDGPTYLGGLGLWIDGASFSGPMPFSSAT